jgi:hypothetical protein
VAAEDVPHADHADGRAPRRDVQWGGLAKIRSWNFRLLGQRIVTIAPSARHDGLLRQGRGHRPQDPAFVETPVRGLIAETAADRRARRKKDGSSFYVAATAWSSRWAATIQQGHGVHVRNMHDWHGVF